MKAARIVALAGASPAAAAAAACMARKTRAGKFATHAAPPATHQPRPRTWGRRGLRLWRRGQGHVLDARWAPPSQPVTPHAVQLASSARMMAWQRRAGSGAQRRRSPCGPVSPRPLTADGQGQEEGGEDDASHGDECGGQDGREKRGRVLEAAHVLWRRTPNHSGHSGHNSRPPHQVHIWHLLQQPAPAPPQQPPRGKGCDGAGAFRPSTACTRM